MFKKGLMQLSALGLCLCMVGCMGNVAVDSEPSPAPEVNQEVQDDTTDTAVDTDTDTEDAPIEYSENMTTLLELLDLMFVGNFKEDTYLIEATNETIDITIDFCSQTDLDQTLTLITDASSEQEVKDILGHGELISSLELFDTSIMPLTEEFELDIDLTMSLVTIDEKQPVIVMENGEITTDVFSLYD